MGESARGMRRTWCPLEEPRNPGAVRLAASGDPSELQVSGMHLVQCHRRGVKTINPVHGHRVKLRELDDMHGFVFRTLMLDSTIGEA